MPDRKDAAVQTDKAAVGDTTGKSRGADLVAHLPPCEHAVLTGGERGETTVSRTHLGADARGWRGGLTRFARIARTT